jgi:hypothetical protein
MTINLEAWQVTKGFNAIPVPYLSFKKKHHNLYEQY